MKNLYFFGLVGALFIQVGCTLASSSSAPLASSQSNPNTTSQATKKNEAEQTGDMIALRGIPTTIPIDPQSIISSPPHHGVVSGGAGELFSYRSANGWSGFDTLTAALLGKRITITIDVDRHVGVLELLSGAQIVSSSEEAPSCDSDGNSVSPSVSSDGCWVAFVSSSQNLSSQPAHGEGIFLADRKKGTVTRIADRGHGLDAEAGLLEASCTIEAGPQVTVDAHGTAVAYVTFLDGIRHIEYKKIPEGVVQDISQSSDGMSANGDSGAPTLDALGTFVVFQSDASNLVNNDKNQCSDIFIRSLSSASTQRVSQGLEADDANGPSACPTLSGNGKIFSFHSVASNLVENDSNSMQDVFVGKVGTPFLERVSIPTDRVNGDMSAEADGPSGFPSLSADGNMVVFQSWASNLVDDDTNRCCDIFVRDRRSGVTRRINLARDGSQADGPSVRPVISADGRFVAFLSAATNLVEGEPGRHFHIFRYDRLTGQMRRLDHTCDGSLPMGDSHSLTMDASGSVVVFANTAAEMVPELMSVDYSNIYAVSLPSGVIN